jgi:hypothetical protein
MTGAKETTVERSTPADWPTGSWSLTAPESYVLQHGPTASGQEAFKLALRELVVRGVLRIAEVEERGRLWGTRRTAVLTTGARPTPPTEQSLASPWLLFSGIPLQTFPDGVVGVPVADHVKQATRRYGANLQRYVTEEVLSVLIDRRLYAREEYRVLWLFPAARVVLTPAGRTAQQDLARRLEVGQAHFGGWVDRDPGRALAFMGLAGASVLLMSDQYPDFQRLQRQFPPQTGGDTGGGAAATWTDSGDDDRPAGATEQAAAGAGLDPGGLNLGGLNLGGLDLGALDLGGFDLSGLSFDVDFSSLDTLDSAFASIDSAVESGSSGDSGGDSGGDGGGGDGGGGGE